MCGLVFLRIQSPRSLEMDSIVCQQHDHADVTSASVLFANLRAVLLHSSVSSVRFVDWRMVAMMVGIDQHNVSKVRTTIVLVHPPRHSLSSSSVVSFSTDCSILAT